MRRQDYTLLLAKNGDVWFCGENQVSQDHLRTHFRSAPLLDDNWQPASHMHAIRLSLHCIRQFGQRGGGSWDGRYPALILGGQNVNRLACGESHMTVSTADGRAYSWGLNDWVRPWMSGCSSVVPYNFCMPSSQASVVGHVFPS